VSRYFFTDAIAGFFELPTTAARGLLPAGLEPVELRPGTAVFSLTAFHFRDSEVGPYDDAVMAVSVTPRVAPGLRFPKAALYPVQVATSTALSRQHGIERWHLPHYPHDIAIAWSFEAGAAAARIVAGGLTVADLRVTEHRRSPVAHVYQCFMDDASGRLFSEVTMEGGHSEHEEERGSLTLAAHPFNQLLPIEEIATVPFRETWMKEGVETFGARATRDPRQRQQRAGRCPGTPPSSHGGRLFRGRHRLSLEDRVLILRAARGHRAPLIVESLRRDRMRMSSLCVVLLGGLVVGASSCGSSSTTNNGDGAAGSGGSGGAGGGGGTAGGDAASGEVAPAATFTDVYNMVIAARCTPCHTTASGTGVSMGHLDMTSKAAAFMNLVNVAAAGTLCAGKGTRVKPGAPDDSIMYLKVSLDDPTPCGSKMPMTGGALTQDQADMIESWIMAGAQNN
jgi:uncharacterized membrane protein YgcG